MPKNISISFSGIITIYYLFNRLNRNTASRVISLFEMPIKKIINFARLFCSNDDLRLTLTYFTSRSNLLPNAFKWENFRNVDFFENC